MILSALTRVPRQPWIGPVAATTSLLALLLAGCGPCAGPGGSGDGKSVRTTATRQQSEYDYYCTLHPSAGEHGLSKNDRHQAFAPTVYAAMRARGYKVFLVHYTWRRAGDPSYPVSGGLPGGYGMRDFFGTPTADMVATQPTARSAAANNNASVGGRAGYGFRHFFGLDADDAESPQAATGTRAAVVWETRRGEFFLVDHYYASPVWLDGDNWLEKVRFFDPAAAAVEVTKS